MAIAASKIIADVLLDLQDDGTRWPAAELVGHLNDGQRQAVEMNPGCTATLAMMTLAEGIHQQAPATVHLVMDVLANGPPRHRPISRVEQSLLDATDPTWRGSSPAGAVVHWMFDAQMPTSFDVYPPARVGIEVQCKFSMKPVDVPAPPGGAASVSGVISLRDEYANALRHYVLFRAWSKDAEYGGNAALAQSHWALFTAALGADVAAVASANQQPTTT